LISASAPQVVSELGTSMIAVSEARSLALLNCLRRGMFGLAVFVSAWTAPFQRSPDGFDGKKAFTVPFPTPCSST